jgi:hypothetical protein
MRQFRSGQDIQAIKLNKTIKAKVNYYYYYYY